MRLLLFFPLLLLWLAAPAQQQIRDVDAAEFKRLINGGGYVLIDLRTDDEISRKGKIKGAQQINFLALDAEERIAGLDKKKKYLVYCASGGRSSDCAALMKEKGFPVVVNLARGFDDWKKKGYEVQTINAR